MSAKKVDVANLDLYGILEIDTAADDQEIKKAYRKKALKCHPDKNPDNPKAIEEFHILSKALELLLDSVARKAYDKVLKAKCEAKKRVSQLDAKRQKLKADLEAREKNSDNTKTVVKLSAQEEAVKLQREIERLRKEGSKQLEEEQELVRQELLKERENLGKDYDTASDNSNCRMKAKWKFTKPAVYTEESIRKLFSKYGEISCLVISKKSALIEFSNSRAAKLAVAVEKGYGDNPLSTELLGQSFPSEPVLPKVATQPAGPANHLDDYEDQIFAMMRQAQVRKNEATNS